MVILPRYIFKGKIFLSGITDLDKTFASIFHAKFISNHKKKCIFVTSNFSCKLPSLKVFSVDLHFEISLTQSTYIPRFEILAAIYQYL